MRYATVLVVLIVAAVAQAEVTWETDFEGAKLRALKEGKLLFLDFYTDT